MKLTLPVLFASLLLSACSTLPDLPVNATEVRTLEDAKTGNWICVLQPADASYFGAVDNGSGNAIATKIRDSLRKLNQPSIQVSQLDTNAHALCLERGAKRFLTTTVQHYEDRKSGLFGKPDRIELLLTLYAVDDLDNRKSIVFEAKTNLLRSALLEWGNNKPSALLDDEFEKVVWNLVHVDKKPTTHADSFGLN